MSALAEESASAAPPSTGGGDREDLLGTVLAEATVHTFREAAADADPGGAVEPSSTSCTG